MAIGQAALYTNSTGNYNVAVGTNSLLNNTSNNNTAIGNDALRSNTTGTRNVAVGYQAGDATTTALDAVAVGHNALGSNTTGNGNTSVGTNALSLNTAGSFNTSIGGFANESATGGSNTSVGYNAGSLITTGSKNTILGRYNGNQGGLDIRTSDNYIVLSDGDGNPRVYVNPTGLFNVAGAYANTTGAPANLNVDPNGWFTRSTSSLRYKNTINDATHGLTELLALRPVTYKGNNNGDTVFGGLIAEEVHDAGLTEFVTYNNDGEPDALAYGNMVSLCIKAIQEQQETITALTARIEALEA